MSNNKYILITNPLSGHYNKNKIDNFINDLEKNNIEVIVYNLQKTQKIADIINTINSDEINNLIFAFGDGTINSACNALLTRQDYYKFNISILAMGTANILAMELNCGNIKKTTKAILQNNIKKVHIGQINNSNSDINRYFSLMASAGFDSYVVRNINEKLKNKIGKLAYIYGFIKLLLKRDFKKIVTILDNGEKINNILTCASNGRYYGTKIAVTNSSIDNSDFDVVIIKKFNLLSMIKYLITKKSNKNIIYTTSKKLNIISNIEKYPMQIDGDYFCDLPIEIKTTDKFLNFIYFKD